MSAKNIPAPATADAAASLKADRAGILRLAVVPEHSAPFMETASGGRAFVHEGYLFLAGDSWLTGIGYPLGDFEALGGDSPEGGPGGTDWRDVNRGSFQPERFAGAILSALPLALEAGLLHPGPEQSLTGGVDVFAVAPSFPARLQAQVTERDFFYLLPSNSGIPRPLRRFVRQAAAALRVEEGAEFTPDHRRLWSELMTRPGLRPNVRELYAKTEALLRAGVPGLSLLNALDREGRLAASLLLDFAPEKFCSYILGAHSRRNYSPHATDLLFAAMLEKAVERGKLYIHLGLGVNAGIARFKAKWGGKPVLPFEMAVWREKLPDVSGVAAMRGLMRDMLSQPVSESNQALFGAPFRQRPYAMLWELEKDGRKSWIGGTAHFFAYGFERSFKKLFKQVDRVIFEGPLDDESLAHFERSGRARQPGDPCLHDLLTPDELRRLVRTVRGPEGGLARLLNHEHPNKADVEDYLKNTRPWFAFFSLWSAFLERQGWRSSVDLDAWRQARAMGKRVIALESREEQLASLETIPVERIVKFFRNCRDWPRYMRRNLRAYLLGDLGGMAGTSTEFPTQIHTVIGQRDRRFCERMLPFINQGRSAVFVGSAHMLNLRGLLAAQGFKVAKVSPGPLHKLKTSLHAALRPGCDLR